MKRLADLHTHTPLCGHARGTPEEFARAAVEHNLSHYGISDHFPLPPDTFAPGDEYLSLSEYQRYRDWVAEMRRCLSGTNVIPLYGVEFDYLPGQMDRTLALLRREAELDLDYRIFSVHFAFGLSFDNPRVFPKVWATSDGPRQIWNRYLETLSRMVADGGFEVIGHIDLPKIFAIYPEDFRHLQLAFHDILKTAAGKGICVEINTAGLRKPVGEMYPSRELLKMAFDVGVGITLGSDAHSPEQVALNFDRALDLAKSVGYRAAFAFNRLKPVELPI